MRDQAFFLALSVLLCCTLFAHGAVPPVDHTGAPLPPDLSSYGEISIAPAPYPTKPNGEMISKDGHQCVLEMRFGGAGHTNDIILHFQSPAGKALQVEFKPTYWETSDCRWINEDLLFVRIWWGRHWGSDYIFDADTEKMVYAEEFDEHRVPIKGSD